MNLDQITMRLIKFEFFTVTSLQREQSVSCPVAATLCYKGLFLLTLVQLLLLWQYISGKICVCLPQLLLISLCVLLSLMPLPCSCLSLLLKADGSGQAISVQLQSMYIFLPL